MKMINVKPGMRVWSDMLGEYFTVQSVRFNGTVVTLEDGCYAMSGFPGTNVKVEHEKAQD